MGTLKVMDCTLRDGGYINDWNFGSRAIREIIKKLSLSGIDYVEIGFMKDLPYDKNRTIFPGNDEAAGMIAPKNPETLYFGMIDMGKPLPLEKLGKRRADSLDGIRVIFKKFKIQEGYDYCKKLTGLGYLVFAQLVGTDEYSDIELVETVQKFNDLDILGLSIVDTFGLIKRKDFIRMASIIDHNLRPDIALAYHSHNNLQQAMGNASALVEMNLKRDVVIDGTVFGMGRGAGNLNMELFLNYLNDEFGRHYRIEPILEIIDDYIYEIYNKETWGYSLPFYLSATNGCHPNYAKYFAERGSLTVKAFNEILRTIQSGTKEIYSKDEAEKIYASFQENYIDDRQTLEKLEGKLSDKEILLLGSGRTLKAQKDDIGRFIAEHDPQVIALNFMPESYRTDYIFSCNMRRYSKLQDCTGVKKIVTSNVRDAQNYDYRINFSSYKIDNPEIIDNSGLMCIRFLIDLGVKDVYLAGIDGYSIDSDENYVNSGLEYNFSLKSRKERNILISQEIEKLNENIGIHFITKSVYDEESRSKCKSI